jgi:hypothetical protein
VTEQPPPRRLDNDINHIVAGVVLHHRDNPNHGINCACMDDAVRQIRELTTAVTPEEQRRVDYVLRAATENRR